MEGFGDWQSPVVGLESTWQKKRDIVNETMQTEPIQKKDKSNQSHQTATTESKLKDCEKEPSDFMEKYQESILFEYKLNAKSQTDETLKLELELNPYPPSLYAFLAKVIDPMCEALQENLSPFNVRLSGDFYGTADDDDDRNADNETIKMYELRSSTAPSNFEASCVSWSPTGNQVAVGYRSTEHDNWCTHSTPVSIWNLARLRPDIDKSIPHKEILFSACCTVVEFHPKDGNLLAAGFYSGEIALIDVNSSNIQKDEGEVNFQQSRPGFKNQEPTKIVDGSCHSTSVVGIHWVILSQSQTLQLVQKNPNPSNFFILSAGKDGFIGLWSLNKTFTRIFLERKFVAYSENLPDNVSIPKRTLSRIKEIGITALSTCKDDPATFVFATYGSMILQGDLLTTIEINDLELKTRSSPKETAPLMNGVTSFVTNQQGYISAIDCSPYHRNLVLSTTLTGHVILQNLLQLTPTLQFYMDENTVTDVKWSGRAMMFGVAEGTKLSLIDLLVSKIKPTLIVPHNVQLRAIAFEKTDTGMVATTDKNGGLHIWKLPKSISSHQFTELDALIDLGQINKVAEIESP